MKIEEFKRGVALMSTRPFGEKFSEELVLRLFNYERSNTNHDLINGNKRIEVKFSRIFNKPKGKGINYIINCSNKGFNSKDSKYIANFQKIHPDEFDVMIFGIVFDEGIRIYKLNKNKLKLSNQHLNNNTMKQFSISNSNEDKYKEFLFINWEDIIKTLSK